MIIKSISLTEDYDTGARSVAFDGLILWEPKLGKKINYKAPHIESAIDNTGRSLISGSRRSRTHSWSSSYRESIEIGRGWSPLKIKNVPNNVTGISDLSLQCPVQLVTGQDECTFENIKEASLPIVKEAGENTISIDSAVLSGPTCNIKATIKGKHLGWNTHKFAVYENGQKLADLHSNGSRSSIGSMTLTLAPRNYGRRSKKITYDGNIDIVVTYPSKTVAANLKFDFKNLTFPQVSK